VYKVFKSPDPLGEKQGRHFKIFLVSWTAHLFVVLRIILANNANVVQCLIAVKGQILFIGQVKHAAKHDSDTSVLGQLRRELKKKKKKINIKKKKKKKKQKKKKKN
jgi:hypothetical protein